MPSTTGGSNVTELKSVYCDTDPTKARKAIEDGVGGAVQNSPPPPERRVKREVKPASRQLTFIGHRASHFQPLFDRGRYGWQPEKGVHVIFERLACVFQVHPGRRTRRAEV